MSEIKACAFGREFEGRIWVLAEDFHAALATERAAREAGTKMLADCFRMAGADCDGNDDSRISPRALRAVTDLRRDYDEACNEAHELRAQLSALRSRCEGLAAEFDATFDEASQSRDVFKQGYASGLDLAAHKLRELLSAGGAD